MDKFAFAWLKTFRSAVPINWSSKNLLGFSQRNQILSSFSSVGFCSGPRSADMPRDEIEKIGNKIAIKFPERTEVRMDSLWANNTCVITYFRRFG
jgi:hypothetical protein